MVYSEELFNLVDISFQEVPETAGIWKSLRLKLLSLIRTLYSVQAAGVHDIQPDMLKA